jgi:hypothetical protein
MSILNIDTLSGNICHDDLLSIGLKQMPYSVYIEDKYTHKSTLKTFDFYKVHWIEPEYDYRCQIKSLDAIYYPKDYPIDYSCMYFYKNRINPAGKLIIFYMGSMLNPEYFEPKDIYDIAVIIENAKSKLLAAERISNIG